MKISVLSFFLLSLISGSLASVGDTCGWAEKKGTCQDVKDCDGGKMASTLISIVIMPRLTP